MTEDPRAALHGGVGLLERAITYALGSVAAVRASDLPKPTPCPEWTLRDLLAHLDDALLALAEAAEEGRVRPPSHAAARGDPVAGVRRHARRALGGWIRATGETRVRVGGAELTAALLAGTGALEVAVHGWDVARACGQDRPIPPALAEELLELAPLFVTEADRPGRFAPAVPVPPLSGPGERLVAFLGRSPALEWPAPLAS